MARDLILETTFLIDLEREAQRGDEGPAMSLLERESLSNLFITFTVAGELAAGTSLQERPAWNEFIAPFQVLPSNAEVCWQYGKMFRYLQGIGLLIGSNDLWIAATAIANGMPLVTRNAKHFRRVPDLVLVPYQ